MSSVVLDSIENPERNRCVDLFRRDDGSFGFEEYRRDAEGGGWFAIGHYAGVVFETESTALDEARARVAWLAQAVKTGGS